MALARTLGLVLLASQGFAHGGAYRGPEDPVAPGVGVRASIPAPRGPAGPGPGSPGVPSSASGGPVVRFEPPDHSTWELWWAFHREAWIGTPGSVLTPHQRARAMTSIGAFLSAEDDETLAAALIAYAKCGGDREEILPHLNGSQVVAEAATVALGIAGDAKSLLALFEGSEKACGWLDSKRVPPRIRAFAVLGLGRPHILKDGQEAFIASLLPYLTGEQDDADDVVAACALAFGRVRLPEGRRSEGPELQSRADQVAWAQATLARPAIPWIGRAHLLTSLALLVEDEGERLSSIQLLVGRLERGGAKPPYESLGCLIALGSLVDAEGGEVDQSAARLLVEYARAGHRDLAGPSWVSIARIAARIQAEGHLGVFERSLGEPPSKEGALGDWAELAHALVATGITEAHATRRPGSVDVTEGLTALERARMELFEGHKPMEVEAWLLAFDQAAYGRDRARELRRFPGSAALLDPLLERTTDPSRRPHAIAALGCLTAPSPSYPYADLFHHRAATPVLVGDGRGLFDLF